MASKVNTFARYFFCYVFFSSLKPFLGSCFFATILGNTFSQPGENLFDSYAAIFVARCRSCNCAANVKTFLKLRKFFRNSFFFSKRCICTGGSYSTYNLFTLDIYIFKFQFYRNRELLYIIIYNNLIIYINYYFTSMIVTIKNLNVQSE